MGGSRGGHTIGGHAAAHVGNLKELLAFLGGHGSGIDVDTLDGKHATDFLSILEVVSVAAANKVLKLDGAGKLPASITGNADGNAATANKLQTARTISLSGAASGSVSFDGSGNVTITTTVSSSATADKWTTPRTITLSGDVTGSVSMDGSGNATLTTTYKNSGVTAGTYTKVTTDIKGNITSATTLAATDIPVLDWSKITTGKPTTLGGYGITDAINVSEMVTTAAANKLLKLNGSGILPASITGNADTVDNLHASSFMRSDATTGTTGDLSVGGIVKCGKATWQVAFNPGEMRKTIVHNIGSTNYMCSPGSNSAARHASWDVKAATTIDIVLDAPYMDGPILVDVILLGY